MYAVYVGGNSQGAPTWDWEPGSWDERSKAKSGVQNAQMNDTRAAVKSDQWCADTATAAVVEALGEHWCLKRSIHLRKGAHDG